MKILSASFFKTGLLLLFFVLLFFYVILLVGNPRRLSSLVRALAILGVVRALDIFAQMLLVFWGRKRINRLPGEHGSTFATCC